MSEYEEIGGEHQNQLAREYEAPQCIGEWEEEPASEEKLESDLENDPEDAYSTIIDKGNATLIISNSAEDDSEISKSTPITVVPRVALAPSSLQQNTNQDDQRGILRLEREANHGKDRIKVDVATMEPLPPQPDQAEKQEEQWGLKKMTPGWWVAIAGTCAAIIILGGLALMSLNDGDQAQAIPTPPPRPKPDDPHQGSPEKWFHQRAGKIGNEAIAVLRSYIAATDSVSRSQWVRRPNIYLENVGKWNVTSRPRLENADEHTWEIAHTGDTAFLILDAKDSEFLPFRAYFVRDGENLKLDWQATTALSDAPLKTIKNDLKKPPASTEIDDQSLMIRCVMRRKEEFYNGAYNDREHSAFMLLSPDMNSYVWAYTLRDSDLDNELRRLLDHGRFVVDLKKDVRVTLRIQHGKKDALPSQLELVEIVHPEWVTP